jgi:hypothetical protein
MTPAEQCLAEIREIEFRIRRGDRDLEGLCLALSDWSHELRLVLAEQEKERAA